MTTPDPNPATCPGCGRPVEECQADDVDEWKITYEHVDPQDPMIADPRWREALNVILGFAEANERHHTGFRHIRRLAQAALGKGVTS